MQRIIERLYLFNAFGHHPSATSTAMKGRGWWFCVLTGSVESRLRFMMIKGFIAILMVQGCLHPLITFRYILMTRRLGPARPLKTVNPGCSSHHVRIILPWLRWPLFQESRHSQGLKMLILHRCPDGGNSFLGEKVATRKGTKLRKESIATGSSQATQ